MKGAFVTVLFLIGMSANAQSLQGAWELGEATLTEPGVGANPCDTNDAVYLTITKNKRITVKLSAVCGPVALPEQIQYLNVDGDRLMYKGKLVGQYDEKSLSYDVTRKIDGYSINANINVSLIDIDTARVTAVYTFGAQVMQLTGVLKRKESKMTWL